MRYASNRVVHKIEQRYPRIIRLMQFAACLSTSEAAGCIRDYVDGSQYSGEAVNHYGGTHAVMASAMRLRTRYDVRAMLASTYRP